MRPANGPNQIIIITKYQGFTYRYVNPVCLWPCVDERKFKQKSCALYNHSTLEMFKETNTNQYKPILMSSFTPMLTACNLQTTTVNEKNVFYGFHKEEVSVSKLLLYARVPFIIMLWFYTAGVCGLAFSQCTLERGQCIDSTCKHRLYSVWITSRKKMTNAVTRHKHLLTLQIYFFIWVKLRDCCDLGS